MNKSVGQPFEDAATSSHEKSEFKKHYRILKDEMRKLLRTLPTDNGDPTYLNPIEDGLKHAFTNFLKSMDYQLALGNFEILLKEKSGAKKFRNDDSVNWYHEFLPIFELLTMASQGSENHGFNIEDIQDYGGLETLISTHLRHDSKEDFKKLHEIMDEQMGILGGLQSNPKYSGTKGRFLAEGITDNVDLISQKRISNGSLAGIKENTIDYIFRIVANEKSNPIVLLCKMADIGNNLATMLKSEKFTPDKKLKICNDREDMFGPRQGFTEEAMERWPKFKSAIKTLDCSMGLLLYPHFRYLTNVDLHYKEPTKGRVGIEEYLKAGLGLDIPEEFNKIHIFFKRMETSVSENDPQKYLRLSDFMRDIIKPALQRYSNKFSYLFGANDNQKTAPALPKVTGYAPNNL